jgi:RNA polymerase sigma-70 factor (ECF subfamily)
LSGEPGKASAPELPPEVLRALPERRPEALEAFYEAYFQRIYGYVRRLLRDEHQAEDLTQDIFMHIHRSLGRYDPTRDLKPWVFTIATNKVRDYWSSRRHRESVSQVSIDEEGERSFDPESEEPEPRERLESAERSGQVTRAIGNLPEGLRTTLLLRYYEGLSFQEIGTIIDRSEVAVRKRYSRALEELRGSLAGMHPEAPGEAK